MCGNQIGASASGRVLIVDDSARLRALLRRALTVAGVPGPVAEGGDAEQAVRILDCGFAPALVLLDMCLPGRSGMDVLPELRRRAPDAFIAVLSGLSAGEVERAGLAAGADLYLAKTEGLAAAIRRLLTHWTPSVAAPRPWAAGGDAAAVGGCTDRPGVACATMT